MSGGFILPLVLAMALALAIGLLLDGAGMADWPLREMPATNGAIFLCLLTLAVVAIGLLATWWWPA